MGLVHATHRLSSPLATFHFTFIPTILSNHPMHSTGWRWPVWSTCLPMRRARRSSCTASTPRTTLPRCCTTGTPIRCVHADLAPLTGPGPCRGPHGGGGAVQPAAGQPVVHRDAPARAADQHIDGGGTDQPGLCLCCGCGGGARSGQGRALVDAGRPVRACASSRRACIHSCIHSYDLSGGTGNSDAQFRLGLLHASKRPGRDDPLAVIPPVRPRVSRNR